MNFFEEQDRARRNTSRLIILMTLAVIGLIGLTCLALIMAYRFFIDSSGSGLNHAQLIAWVSAIVISVVAAGSLYKHLQLSGGGKVVAEQLGGRMINLEPRGLHERRLLNVVEEMALASGTPVPPVYVLDDPAINAFAAGKTPQDAVIGITRGAIEALSREELQGVIAHEFSHVFHGDMKLNIRLVAVLHGILLIGLFGSFLLRGANIASSSRSREGKSGVLAIIVTGAALLAIGYIGTFFGNWIKAAVSRQREYLADASAVQYTRNPNGICGALKKIGGSQYGSLLQADNATQFSHLYFGQGVSLALEGMLATHPPLEKRIRRIDPSWDGRYPAVQIAPVSTAHDANEMAAGFTSHTATPPSARWEAELANLDGALDLEIIDLPLQAADASIDAIGAPQQAHLQQARSLLQSIPSDLHKAAHHPLSAQALVLGLLLDADEQARQHQQKQLKPQISEPLQAELERLHSALLERPDELTLPLIELSIPALKTLSDADKLRLRRNLSTLILADRHVSLREWSLLRIIERNISGPRPLQSRYRLAQVEHSLSILLTGMTLAGHTDSQEQACAFQAARQLLALPNLSLLTAESADLKALDKALRELNQLMPLEKPKLLKALAACMAYDGKISSAEAELMRAIADSLDCPMPPLLAA